MIHRINNTVLNTGMDLPFRQAWPMPIAANVCKQSRSWYMYYLFFPAILLYFCYLVLLRIRFPQTKNGGQSSLISWYYLRMNSHTVSRKVTTVDIAWLNGHRHWQQICHREAHREQGNSKCYGPRSSCGSHGNVFLCYNFGTDLHSHCQNHKEYWTLLGL